MQIIGLTGKKRHGKSTFCEELWQRIPGKVLMINFKDPLLAMARMIGWNGKKDERGRRLLQRLGTDVVRECIDEDYWVKKWRFSVERASHWGADLTILVDDVRFDNEALAVKRYGGVILQIITPDQDVPDNHVSEVGIDESFIDHKYVLRFGLTYIQAAAEEFYGSYKF